MAAEFYHLDVDLRPFSRRRIVVPENRVRDVRITRLGAGDSTSVIGRVPEESAVRDVRGGCKDPSTTERCVSEDDVIDHVRLSRVYPSTVENRRVPVDDVVDDRRIGGRIDPTSKICRVSGDDVVLDIRRGVVRAVDPSAAPVRHVGDYDVVRDILEITMDPTSIGS